jgi:hypothetical protein
MEQANDLDSVGSPILFKKGATNSVRLFAARREGFESEIKKSIFWILTVITQSMPSIVRCLVYARGWTYQVGLRIQGSITSTSYNPNI